MAELGLDPWPLWPLRCSPLKGHLNLGAGNQGIDGVGGSREPRQQTRSLGETMLSHFFFSIPPLLSLLRAQAFSKGEGPPPVAKGFPLYSYGSLHTRANIFLGFFQSWKI